MYDFCTNFQKTANFYFEIIKRESKKGVEKTEYKGVCNE